VHVGCTDDNLQLRLKDRDGKDLRNINNKVYVYGETIKTYIKIKFWEVPLVAILIGI
jgi:hypothetical protein